MNAGPDGAAPVIALTVEVLDAPWYEGRRRYQLFTDYLACLRAQGAVPMLVPGDAGPEERERLLARADGILLTGGDDADLRAFGGPAPTEECKPVPRAQQDAAIALARLARERDMPLLGVCFGMQMLGLACGAGFEQHLPNAADHAGGARHGVRVEGGTRLRALAGAEDFEVASFHHQALTDPGDELVASAWAGDGVLEGVEHPDMRFGVGVQWHPERTPRADASRRIFSRFAEAARGYRSAP